MFIGSGAVIAGGVNKALKHKESQLIDEAKDNGSWGFLEDNGFTGKGYDKLMDGIGLYGELNEQNFDFTEDYVGVEKNGFLGDYDPSKPVLINPAEALSGDEGASTLLGALSRAQWDDYKARFDPVLDELIGRANDRNAPQAAADKAMAASNSSFDNAGRGLALEQSRLGLSMTPDQQASRDRKLSLAKAGSATSVANEARMATQDSQKQLIAGQAALTGLEGSAFANPDN